MSEFDRVRWHCRRGLLELDLVFARFLEAGYGHLTPSQKSVFSGLLELADNDLWDFVSGRRKADDAAQEEVLEMLRRA